MAERRIGVQGLQSTRAHLPPVAIPFGPIQRRCPALRLDNRPTVRHPQGWGAVAAVPDERQVFRVAHQSTRNLAGPDKGFMRGSLVVEAEAGVLMTESHDG